MHCSAPCHTVFSTLRSVLWVSQRFINLFSKPVFIYCIHQSFDQIYQTHLAWPIHRYHFILLFKWLESAVALHLFFFVFLFSFYIFTLDRLNNFMLCVYRGEAVCLFHVWHEVFPALPPGETQTHSYGYASLYRTHFCLNFLS